MSKWPTQGFRRLFRLGSVRPEVERDLDDELAFHFEEAVRAARSRGLSEDDARRDAEARFGDIAAYRRRLARVDNARLRWARFLRARETIGESARSLVRSARRAPHVAAGVIITLALGIGANATMYGILDRVLLSAPDDIVDADQVRVVYMERPRGGSGPMMVAGDQAYPDYLAMKGYGGLRVAAFSPALASSVERAGLSGPASVASVSAEFFPVLGVTPYRGRFFDEREAAAGSPLTAVVSAEYWTRVYGADPNVLGSTIEIAGQPYTLIGVAPSGFTGVDVRTVDFWVPLEATEAADGNPCMTSYGCSSWWVVGHLEPGVSDAAAQAAMTSLVVSARRAANARVTDQASVVLRSLVAAKRAEATPESLLALSLVVVSLIVLVIACANVANLLMARGLLQRRDLAVRLTLGAGRPRLVAQAVLESVMLSLVGACVAIGVARWGGALIRSTLVPDVYFPAGGLTGRLLVLTLVLAVAAGLAAAVGPMLLLRRTQLSEGMRHGSVGNSPRRSRAVGLLTNAQAALSVVLLVGAVVFIRSVREAGKIDLGVDVDHLLVATPFFRDPQPTDRALELYAEAVDRLEDLPAVQSAASTHSPMGTRDTAPLEVVGVDSIPELPGGGPYIRSVSEAYFETAGVEMLQGRPFRALDNVGEAVVNETMARTLWPGGDALGSCLRLYGSSDCLTVVGVSADEARQPYSDEPYMAYYVPQHEVGPLDAIYVRVDGDPRAARGEVARVLSTSSPEVRTARVETFADVLDFLDPTARAWRIAAVLFSFFGVLAICLVGVGLYAVLACEVTRRSREIGIRSALGAGRLRLTSRVLMRASRLTAVGMGLGLLFVYVLAPYAQPLLFRASPRDPETLVSVVALLGTTLLAGALVPGLRATRVSPTTTLTEVD